jgi:hypothetical protein
MNKNLWKIAAIVSMVLMVGVLVGGGVVLIARRHTKSPTKSDNSVEQFTHLDIKLKDGKLVDPQATYLVKPGVGLDFSIESNFYGKVSVPTNPSQTIIFTQSPLTFRFRVPIKPGNYPLSYEAQRSQKVIQIGLIVVRGK